jgi:hypothetical protein
VSGVYPSCALYREEWWADKTSMIPAYAKFASHYVEAYMLVAAHPSPSSDPSQALQPKSTLPGNLRTERSAAPLSATLE